MLFLKPFNKDLSLCSTTNVTFEQYGICEKWSAHAHDASIEFPSHGQRRQKIIQKPLRSRKNIPITHECMSLRTLCRADMN